MHLPKMDSPATSTPDDFQPSGMEMKMGAVMDNLPVEATPPLTRDASPSRTTAGLSFYDLVRLTNGKLRLLRTGESIKLDGESLDIASLVAVSR